MTSEMLLGRYELRRLIGRGGMAEVWEARDTRLGRRVAVKTVNLAAAHDPAVGERLQREAVAIASLRHPDIVTVHDAGVEGDTAYLVMELIEGTDLAAVIRRGPLPVREALRVAERVAGALTAAHAAGIVHRDIKPANVLLHGEDVTVVDFGIAAATRAAGASLTEPGTVVGTAEYMAPEQAGGGEVSPASDVYSLGCLVTAMLVGRPPFTGAHPLEILRQHVAAAPPRLTTLDTDGVAEVDSLVAALLAKEPAERPSAAAVLRALEELRGRAVQVAAARDGLTEVLPATGSTRTLPATGSTRTSAGTASPRTRPPAIAPAPGTAGARPVGDTGPAGAVPRRRTEALIAGAVVALVVVGALTSALLGGKDPADGSTPAAVGEPAPTASPTPTPTTTPSEAAQPPTTPAEEPARDRAEIVTGSGVPALLASLQADAETQEELRRRWAKVADAMAEGKDDKATDKARDLSKAVDELARDDRLTSAEAEALRGELARALGGDVGRSGEGGGEKADRENGKGDGRDDD